MIDAANARLRCKVPIHVLSWRWNFRRSVRLGIADNARAPDSVLWETTPIADLEAARAADLLWVASIGDEPVGFAHLKHIEPGSVHLDELDVHPDQGRRGIGHRLVTTVSTQTATQEVCV